MRANIVRFGILTAGVTALMITQGVHSPQTQAQYPACWVEDASVGPSPCLWDASEQGNGIGHDAVVTFNAGE